MRVVMRCGHVALGKDMHNHTPVCPICVGLTEDALFAMIPQPNVEGRTAICSVCEEALPSSLELPYFQYKQGELSDEYYCGCREWKEDE